jgi:hypothetical protein
MSSLYFRPPVRINIRVVCYARLRRTRERFSKHLNSSGDCRVNGIDMPDVTEDERGRRVFQIHKEMAVETALDKIRQSVGQDWKLYSVSDIDLLKYMLGESWVSMDRSSWGRCTFSRLLREDLDAIIRIGKEVKNRKRMEGDAVREMNEILRRVS